MGVNFVVSDRDRAFVLPQDIREWLPPEHLCWKVLEVVGEMDLSAFVSGYRRDGQGHAAYPPAMLLALVLYCYSKGLRSSRGIEAACLDGIGCRIIMANHRVDHSTVACFIRRHHLSLRDLFVQILALCDRRGLADLTAVSVDGSPMKANASRFSNHSLRTPERGMSHQEADMAAPGVQRVDGHSGGSGGVSAERVRESARAGGVQQPADRRRARRDTDTEHAGGAGSEPGQGVLRGRLRPLPDCRERACPASTAEQATSSTLTNGWRFPGRCRGSGSVTSRDGRSPTARCRRGRLRQADTGRLTTHRSSGMAGRLDRSPAPTGRDTAIGSRHTTVTCNFSPPAGLCNSPDVTGSSSRSAGCNDGSAIWPGTAPGSHGPMRMMR
ncbi:transposase [Streptomyces sp. NPDC002537]